jgi:hypothetical protein
MAARMGSTIEQRASVYRTNDILMLFGDDFRYMNAQENYKQLDNMISWMNEKHGDKYKFVYSTPS